MPQRTGRNVSVSDGESSSTINSNLETGNDAYSDAVEDALPTDEKNNADESSVDPSASNETNSISSIVQRVLRLKVSSTLEMVKVGAVKFALASCVWLMGYFNFSLLWVFCGVCSVVIVAKKVQRRKLISEISKQTTDEPAKYIENIKSLYRSQDRQLPSWVYFPDVEKAEWLNRLLQQLWPKVGDYVKTLLSDQVQQSVRMSSSLLSSFTFTDVDLGDRAPRVAGIKVYDNTTTSRNEIVMDIQFVFDSDCNLGVSINGLQAGISDLQIRGLLRVEMYPLVPQIPFVGAVSVAFMHEPNIDFNLTHLANFFDLPGIDSLLRGAVIDCIGGLMVLPEKYVVKLCSDVDVSDLKYPMPKGVLRIHIIEAKNLEEKDRKLLGIGGKSDPYVTVKVGRCQKYKTATIQHNINPRWNESFDVLIGDTSITTIEIALYDDDGPLNKADDLGSASLPVKAVYEQGVVDEWIRLSDALTGFIHVRLEWFDLSDDPNLLSKALEMTKGKPNCYASFLSVYADSALHLPDNQVDNFDPSPVLKITPPSGEVVRTQPAIHTNQPVWEEGFRFMIESPRLSKINFELENMTGKGNNLGYFVYPLSELLEADNMTVQQPFPLIGADAQSTINLRMKLRILKPKAQTKKLKAGSNYTVYRKSPKRSKPSPDIAVTTPRKVSVNSDSGSIGRASFEASPAASIPRTPSSVSEISAPGALQDLRQRLTAKLKADPSNGDETNDNGLGRIRLTYRYHKSKLVVVVVRAENLIPCDKDDGTSDPYVRIYLNSDKRNRKKTKVVKNNLNPVFDERLEFEVSSRDVARSKLNVTVKNQTGLLSSEKVLMGETTIDLAETDLAKPTTQWYALKIPDER